MARSPLTLAATVTSALPRVGVVGAAALTEHGAGRYDSALVHLDDARRVVIRVPVSREAADDLDREAAVLGALTAGVRAVLGFTAPEILGRARLGSAPALVVSHLPGYRVDATQVPPGRGVATGLAVAIASVHALPASVVRDAGLPVRTATDVRTETERLLDAAEATGRLPFGLLRRWSRALALDELWRFEPTVTLGGVDPASFTFTDVEGVPTVTGLLTWSGLGVGDPAADLRWTSSAPDAADSVFEAYAAHAHHTPDGMIADRARLHAELEFARWLVHGHETGAETVVADAVALLESLDETVRDEPALSRGTITVDEAIAAIGRVPEAPTDLVDTSMQTDAYDPGTMGGFDEETGPVPSVARDGDETEPIELSDWSGIDTTGPTPGEVPVERDPDEAARNALRRWTGTA